MLSRFFYLLILVTLAACGSFKTQTIKQESFETLIGYIEGQGEGKSRLGIDTQQYLMGFEALLKENHDWVFAASIPLHGEEVLQLQNLKEEVAPRNQASLELRIERDLSAYLKSKNQSPAMARTFLQELRKLMRVVFYKELGLELVCSKTECRIGDSVYQVKASEKELTLKKSLSDSYEVELVATNLTDSIFKRSNIFLRAKNQPPLLSLELFWN